jgi:hypothetical protein
MRKQEEEIIIKECKILGIYVTTKRKKHEHCIKWASMLRCG